MNIAKLNTASLDDKTFIIKRGTSGGGTPDTPSDDGWEYYKFDGEAVENTEGFDAAEFYSEIGGFLVYYYISTAYKSLDEVKEKMLYVTKNWDEHPVSSHLGFKTQTSENLLSGAGLPLPSVMPLKELIDYINEMSGGQVSPLLVAFANALTPCTKEEFEALITQ